MTQTFYIPQNYSYVSFAQKMLLIQLSDKYIREYTITGNRYIVIGDEPLPDHPTPSKQLDISKITTLQKNTPRKNNNSVCLTIRLDDLEESDHPYEDIAIRISKSCYPLHTAILHKDQYSTERILLI